MADESIIPAALSGQGAAPRGMSGAPGVDYRQLERPAEGIQPHHLAHSGGAEHAEALQRAFREFGHTATELGDEFGKKKGAQAGAAAGAAGDGEQKSGLAAMTAYGSAYNASVHAAYVARSQEAARAQLTRISQENPDDPDAFAKIAGDTAKKILDETPNVYKADIALHMQSLLDAGVAKAREQQILNKRREAAAGVVETWDDRIKSGVDTASVLKGDAQQAAVAQTIKENRDLVNAAVAGHAFTPVEGAKKIKAFEEQFAKAVQHKFVDNVSNQALELARAGDIDAAHARIAQFINDPHNNDDDKNQVQDAWLHKVDEFQKLQAQVHQKDTENLYAGLTRGDYGQAVLDNIHSMRKHGILTAEQTHSAVDAEIKNQLQAIDANAGIALVQNRIASGKPFAPDDKEAAKAVDQYYTAKMAATRLAPLSDAWTAGVKSLLTATNILPKSAQQELSIGIVSDDPNMAVKAAMASERIHDSSPQLDPFDGNKRLSMVSYLIAQNTKSGMPAQQAVRMAREAAARDEESRAEDKIQNARYHAVMKDKPDQNVKALPGLLGGYLANRLEADSAPPVSTNTALVTENERLVREGYAMMQDLPKAQDWAARQLATAGWGVMRVNGEPQWVQYPADRLLDAETIHKDMELHAKEGAGFDGDPKSLKLIPTGATVDSHGTAWQVAYTPDPKHPEAYEILLNKTTHRPMGYFLPEGEDTAKAKEAIAAPIREREKQHRVDIQKNRVEQHMFESELADQAFRQVGVRRQASAF